MPKYFTVAEANRTLPLVRRIVADIVTDYRSWREQLTRYELAAASDTAPRGESPAARGARLAMDELAERINDYLDELDGVGCLFKGFEEGLVDFYSKREGRDVLLCWKLDEEEVAYWHEVDGGFGGRQELTEVAAGRDG